MKELELFSIFLQNWEKNAANILKAMEKVEWSIVKCVYLLADPVPRGYSNMHRKIISPVNQFLTTAINRTCFRTCNIAQTLC